MSIEENVNDKVLARKIAKTIIEYGVTDDQKIEIMYNLSLTIENQNQVKKITKFLKNFKTNINNDDEDAMIKNENNIILT